MPPRPTTSASSAQRVAEALDVGTVLHQAHVDDLADALPVGVDHARPEDVTHQHRGVLPGMWPMTWSRTQCSAANVASSALSRR